MKHNIVTIIPMHIKTRFNLFLNTYNSYCKNKVEYLPKFADNFYGGRLGWIL